MRYVTTNCGRHSDKFSFLFAGQFFVFFCTKKRPLFRDKISCSTQQPALITKKQTSLWTPEALNYFVLSFGSLFFSRDRSFREMSDDKFFGDGFLFFTITYRPVFKRTHLISVDIATGGNSKQVPCRLFFHFNISVDIRKFN